MFHGARPAAILAAVCRAAGAQRQKPRLKGGAVFKLSPIVWFAAFSTAARVTGRPVAGGKRHENSQS
jgi:hypothetical protein